LLGGQSGRELERGEWPCHSKSRSAYQNDGRTKEAKRESIPSVRGGILEKKQERKNRKKGRKSRRERGRVLFQQAVRKGEKKR